MAEDKKKNALFGKLLNKRHSDDKFVAPEEQFTDGNEAEFNEVVENVEAESDATPEWLSDVMTENTEVPEEDISEALAELFGDDKAEDSEESAGFAIPGFEELGADGMASYDPYDVGASEDYAENANAEEEQYPEIADEAEAVAEDIEALGDEIVDAPDVIEDTPSAIDSFEEAEADEPSEESQTTNSIDEDTATLLAALGYSDANTVTKTKPAVKENTGKYASDLTLALGYDGKEYTARSQTAAIKSKYAQDKMKTIVRLGATALFAILLCVYDVFGNKFGGSLDPAVYPVVNIMISLQLLLIAAAFSVKRLIVGANEIFKGNLTVYSMSVIAVLISVIYDVVLAITVPESFTLCNFPAAICLLFCALHDYFTIEREISVFDRLSSWQSVVTLERVDSAMLSAELGEDEADGVGTVGQTFRIRKGAFAENYFKHVNRRHPVSKMLAFFVTPSLAIALIIFFISLAFDKTFAQAVNAFAGVSLFSLPMFMFVSMSYPFYKLITKNLSSDAVILNESAVNENRRVDTVVFEEADLFDETSLTINRISVCDKNQMHDVFDIMCAVSAMYNKIGGRIAGAFRASTADGDTPEDVSILSVDDGGFEGMADGRRYCVGSDAYLASKGIAVTRYYDDKYIVSNPGGVVLHIAVDGAEVFKLYLTYNISGNTLALINDFADLKTRIVLRTIDPNVNLELILRILSSSFDGNLTLIRKPFGIVGAEADGKDEALVDGGIIINGEAPEAVLETVNACRFFSAFTKFNFAAGIVVFAIGALLAFVLGIIGAIVDMSSIFIFIYQVLSIIPCIFFSSVYLNK